MSEKREYKKVQKSIKFTGSQEMKFVNKMGLAGWELFAHHNPYKTAKAGWKYYFFRKPQYKP